MIDHPVVLDTAIPMEVAGWGVLLVSLAVTVLWLAYVFR